MGPEDSREPPSWAICAPAAAPREELTPEEEDSWGPAWGGKKADDGTEVRKKQKKQKAGDGKEVRKKQKTQQKQKKLQKHDGD